jgi:hypothetical protein
MTAPPISSKEINVQPRPPRPRPGRRLTAIVLALASLILFGLELVYSGSARAEDPVKGDVEVHINEGFARLMFRLDQEVKADVSVTWPILVIKFAKPVNVSIDRLSGQAADYISAARRDPDGTTIRLALKRQFKINTTPAGDMLFIDLLPDNWTGVMPALPKEVIADLSQRAQVAERLLHKQRLDERQTRPPTIRVKVASQPTFIRYVFELPDGANAVPERDKGTFKLNFDRLIKWDLTDVLANLPPTLKTVEAGSDFDSTVVTFVLKGSPEVRNFHEGNGIAVDVGTGLLKPKSAAMDGMPQVAAAPAIAPPETVPVAKSAPAVQAKTPPPAQPPAERKAAAAAPLVAALAITMPVALAGHGQAPSKPAEGQPAASAALPPPQPPPDPNAPVVVNMHRSDDGLRVEFPFAVQTPAAAFLRADTLSLVFDTSAKIDLAALTSDAGQTIRGSAVEHEADGATIIRIRLARPQLASLIADGPRWIVTLGDSIINATRPLAVSRNLAGANRASITIPFADPRKVHRLTDHDVGDRLIVITALGPARGFVKAQDFVELRTLPSIQGVVVQPLADDITAQLSADKITLGRPGGLTLSSSAAGTAMPRGASTYQPLLFSHRLWSFDRQGKFNSREDELIRQAAEAPPFARYPARINLARFYLANDMSAEAKAVLDVALDGQRPGEADITGSVLRAVSNVMLDRPNEALTELSDPQIGNRLGAQVWRAVALARDGKWGKAYDTFKALGDATATMPLEFQQIAMQAELHSAIEVRDFSGAAKILSEFESIGVPATMAPSLAVLTGKLDEGLGRKQNALAAYQAAAKSADPAAAAQGRLHIIMLRLAAGELPRKDAIVQLETLTTVWRGDETEVEGLKLLAHLYIEDERYRAAFHVMRTATLVFPDSKFTRQIQDEATATFDSLFLTSKGDTLQPIDALALFYDYRELTPIGRRGDEMIRRLADRLVAVDLLDQATELLQHQVDNRLHGAARAQVATRLAVIYLMNHKPDKALAVLQSTRVEDLANELRDQRLLLEARAMSDLGRHDLALEVIADIHSHAATRLRADILWAAKRWEQAAEQIELLYGDRWRDFKPLNEAERNDILRAAIGYGLSDDAIGLARFRDRYAPKMANGPDAHAFDVVSMPIGTSSPEFRDVAQKVVGIDTLDAFLRDMKARYPDAAAPAGADGKDSSDAPPTPAKPQTTPAQAATPTDAVTPPAKAPPAAAPKPDVVPTGSISRK